MSSHLDQQLAGLKLNTAEGQQPTRRKLGPAVPPKPKSSQPQVPKSYQINGPSEPSFTSPLQSTNTDKQRPHNAPIYSNLEPLTVPTNQNRNDHVSSVTYSNIEPYKPEQARYRKADSQALYSNISNNPTYSNIGTYANIVDDLPPPPPEPVEYGDFPPPPADLPPPPSPVSSSYSELRRATHHYQPEYGTYAPSSQGSLTYESIYEPINPRPPSGMSSRSNYSLYTPYVKGSGNMGPQSPRGPQEAEVDALTDLLVQSMDSSAPDSDIFGDCCKCGQRVVGEGSGCTAMDKVYHISCFTCCHCAIQLQGKPFYTLEGKPYCETGYLDTLEKCSVCLSPILDRILRATGRPYHPQCFCCIVCGKSLDGIPFTVDATNQIHCIEDFHKKFAPRCCVCQLPIMPEPGQDETVRVVALDRSFHIACYKCEDCGLVLSSEAEGRGCYPLDDHVLCKSCNAKRVQALTSHMTTEL
uniref:LIM zinc-binding domain-containing protein n=2 Tax=Hemiptera TaxID=7524 RepID=A0A1B6DVF7_9HEMI